jgi:hypothetical protein
LYHGGSRNAFSATPAPPLLRQSCTVLEFGSRDIQDSTGAHKPKMTASLAPLPRSEQRGASSASLSAAQAHRFQHIDFHDMVEHDLLHPGTLVLEVPQLLQFVDLVDACRFFRRGLASLSLYTARVDSPLSIRHTMVLEISLFPLLSGFFS